MWSLDHVADFADSRGRPLTPVRHSGDVTRTPTHAQVHPQKVSLLQVIKVVKNLGVVK